MSNEMVRNEFITFLKTNGIKIKTVGERLGISNSTIYKWKEGTINVSDEKLKLISDFIKKNTLA